MAARITKRTLVGFRDVGDERVNIKPIKLVEEATGNREKLIKELKRPGFWHEGAKGEDMKFNAVVGNPPYQKMGGSGGTNDAPIFQHFCNAAFDLDAESVSMIIPAKWFAAGRENLLAGFRKRMLSESHLNVLKVFPNSREVFPNVEIKGGVCYFLQTKGYGGACNYAIKDGAVTHEQKMALDSFDILIRDPRLAAIVKKVVDAAKKNKESFADTIISSDTPFGIPTNPRTSKKTPFPVSDECKGKFDTKLYLWDKGKRQVAYVRKADVHKNAADIDSPKVFIPGAGGSGNDPNVLGQPIVAEAGSVCSQTFLYAKFGTKKQSENFAAYLKTRFVRALVSAVKITQHAQSPVYRFVPLQDFTSKSDIDWSKGVGEIDRQLYAKYKLTTEEVGFIESMIKPME